MGIVLPGGRLQRGVPELEQRESMRADKLQAGKKKKRRAAGFARPLPKLPIMENSDNRRSPDARLAVGHFLGHVENELAVTLFDLPEQAAKLVKEACIFTDAAPGDVVRRFALGQIR